MNVARIAVLAVALAAGLVAAWLAMNLTRPAPAPQVVRAPQPSMSTEDVLVAAADIRLGTTLDTSSLAWRAWPRDGASSAYITKRARPDAIDEVKGTIARSTFFAGEPITEAKLAHTDGGYLSAILPSGKRAIATSISADTSAGGFILPNDHVDVIMTRKHTADDGTERFITETILNDIRVLAIDQTIEDKNGEKVVVGQTATMELTPEQAEILTVAQQMGDRLALSLRSLADSGANTRAFNPPDAMHLINGGQRSDGVTVVKAGVARQINVGQ